ncbi:hypothetical protein HDU80_009236 [Chytriomyces hyalinus]|nr:hypothetical protein HDU80_009236 [Chytriomyces hyalinus]
MAHRNHPQNPTDDSESTLMSDPSPRCRCNFITPEKDSDAEEDAPSTSSTKRRICTPLRDYDAKAAPHQALDPGEREALRAFRDKRHAAEALNTVLEDKMACKQLYLQQKEAITGQRAKVACAWKAFLEKAAHSSFLAESKMEKASMDNELAVLQVMESIIKDHESTMPNTQELTQPTIPPKSGSSVPKLPLNSPLFKSGHDVFEFLESLEGTLAAFETASAATRAQVIWMCMDTPTYSIVRSHSSTDTLATASNLPLSNVEDTFTQMEDYARRVRRAVAAPPVPITSTPRPRTQAPQGLLVGQCTVHPTMNHDNKSCQAQATQVAAPG